MAQCIYCRQPAGFLRKRHAHCHERHTRALTMIPELFAKALHSSLPATRFAQMLKEAASASFIKPRALGALCIGGISRMVDAVLEERLLTASEEERIKEIKDALGTVINMPDLEEKLIKVSILRELAAGQLPDRVTVAGPMPIELRQHETVIWLFNDVVSFRARAPVTPAPPPSRIGFPTTDKDLYCGIRAFASDPLPMNELVEEATGDLMVTNRNIFFIFGDGQRRISMSKITTLQPRADGIQITGEEPQGRPRTFKLNDPWLAANLIVGLVKIADL